MGPQTQELADAYCSDLVHRSDRDRYLSALFAPEEKRRHIFALYAFNVELSRIRDTTSEPMIGEVRLQWWRETIANLYAGDVADHPVAKALKGAISEGNLTDIGFQNMIDARAFDLYDDPMPSLDALEGYLGETSSALIQMASLVLAGESAEGASDAAGHAGLAFGMAGLLRLVPIHRARGQCFIPRDVLERHDLQSAHILAGRMSQSVSLSVRYMVKEAREHLLTARSHLGEVPSAALPAFLHVALSDLYLRRFDPPKRNFMTEIFEVQQFRRQWHILKAAMFRSY